MTVCAPPVVKSAPAISQPTLAPSVASRRKRCFDVTTAGLALIAFMPLLLLIALTIRLSGGGPVLFRQQRTGLHGRPFRIYKFRTMRVMEDGETLAQASRGDPRVTPIGAVLRKLSLDELPQLLNIVLGDMSIVGPRPHALSHDEAWACAIPGYADRFRTRPGLTGEAQVLGLRGEITSPEGLVARIAADNAYIDGWSFRRDLALVARTVPLLFGDPQAF